MTEIDIYKQIVQKQDELLKYFKSCYDHSSIDFRNGNFFYSPKVKRLTKYLASLRQQLEKAETDKELAEIRGDVTDTINDIIYSENKPSGMSNEEFTYWCMHRLSELYTEQ